MFSAKEGSGVAKIVPCVRWVGSKTQMTEKIVDLLGPHEAYAEPYFGSGAVLLAKSPKSPDIVNDANSILVLFYRVLREQPDDLLHNITLTPCSEEEFRLAGDDPDLPDLERARRFYVRSTMRYGGSEDGGWVPTFVPSKGAGLGDRWRRSLGRLMPVADRLRNVQILNQDALSVIERVIGNSGYAIYLDPPYLDETRDGSKYGHEVDVEHHVQMLDLARSASARVVISGYDSPLYEDRLDGWHRHVVGSYSSGTSGSTRTQRNEVLWVNRRDAVLF